jgi:hypothetical protein
MDHRTRTIRRPVAGRGLLAGLLAAAAMPVFAVAGPGVASAAPLSQFARPTGCAAPSLTAFSFKPRTVVEGQTASLRAVITNCTDRSFSGALETFGQLVCVVVDPIAMPIHLALGATSESRMTYRAPDCTGQGQITGRLLNHHGRVISTRVATLTIVAPPAV